MIKEMIFILIILAGVFNGKILAIMCKDELKLWRKRFFYVAIVCLFLVVGVYFSSFELRIPVIVVLLFMVVTGLVVWKSK
ncbi:hypothetical protein CMI42_05890 [Candidatus Pacearchaeota archaeon]|nr:hypothetical protein [Candidatus Pacearchaeota archaeon]|tara:strand:+ start:104 stop:343 length:240 start_codon:yes stop_codon:yes gene_type:complete